MFNCTPKGDWDYAQQGSPDRYSYGGANSHRSCVDQEDHWVIKFNLGLNLFDLIKMWTPWGRYREEGLRWRWSQVCSIVRVCEHMEHGGYLGLVRIQVKGEIVRIMTWICREDWLMSDLVVSFSGYVLSLSWSQVFFIVIEGILSPSWIQVSFILIEGVCLGLGEFYGL